MEDKRLDEILCKLCCFVGCDHREYTKQCFGKKKAKQEILNNYISKDRMREVVEQYVADDIDREVVLKELGIE